MLHGAQGEISVSPVAMAGRMPAAEPFTWPGIWVITVNDHQACVHARVRSPDERSSGAPSAWWLEPEEGLQLDAASAHATREERDRIELHLARLIAGLVSIAHAGGRFERLVLVAGAATCKRLRAFLNGPARAALLAEVDARPDAGDGSALQALLTDALPGLFPCPAGDRGSSSSV